MTRSVNFFQQSPELSNKLIELGNLFSNTTIEASTRELVEIRASQLNGCAFCVDMHVKLAKIHGERELRLHHLATWRELLEPHECGIPDGAGFVRQSVRTRQGESGVTRRGNACPLQQPSWRGAERQVFRDAT